MKEVLGAIRKVLGTIFRFIVGSEYGMTGEGNQQWYYTVALAISNMLVWVYLPERALIFTILSVIHLISVHLYGFNDWSFEERGYSEAYLALHFILFLISLFTSWWWTIISSFIMAVAYFVAPDCTGNNIFMRAPHRGRTEIFILIFNTALMAIFMGVVILLPMVTWVKVGIIAAAIILHPIIDMLSCECVVFNDTIEDAISVVFKGDIYTQCQKHMEENEKNKS